MTDSRADETLKGPLDFLNRALDGLLLIDRLGRILDANETYASMSSYTRAELRALAAWDLDARETADAVGARIRAIIEAGAGRFETLHRRKDGTTFTAEVSAGLASEGRFAVFIRDISERKKTEEAFRLSEERYRSILAASPDGIAIADMSGRLVMASPAAHRIFGYGVGDFLGRSLAELLCPEDRARGAENLRSLTYDRPQPPREYRAVRSDGGLVDIEINGQYILDAKGQPAQIVFVVRDVTERKETEARLHASDRRHSVILDTAMDGYWLVAPDGKILEVNPAYCRMSGYTLEELRSMSLKDLEAAMDSAEIQRRMEAIQSSGAARFETRHRRKDGTIWDAEVSVRLQDGPGGGNVASFIRDITERKRAEAETAASLREKEKLLREIHHRVKNNLQIITSLLRLESARRTAPGIKAVLGEMQSRVLAMALLHETLYRTGDFGHLNLAAYLENLGKQLLRAQGGLYGAVALELGLEAVAVDLDQAIPCGLAVNELLTNCLKHAFGERAGGTIRMTLTEAPDLGICIAVSDDGRGLPEDFDERRRQSLGLQLVSDLAAQLRGRLDIGPGPRFALIFPRRPTNPGFPREVAHSVAPKPS